MISFIVNPLMHLNKHTQLFLMSMRYSDSFSHLIIMVVPLTIVSLIFNYHIVHYDTSFHDITDFFTFPSFSRSSNNGKMGLQNSKGSFHILSGSLLPLGKMFLLCALWSWYGLHKCCPLRIYAICKVIPHCVVMTIDAIIHFWSFTFG